MRSRWAHLVLALVLAGCAELRERYPGPDVVFIATPERVSVEMLRIAAVTPQDVVFDLGSGDGRVVIAAAREFGARGVGVEIDPALVRDSREAVANAGLTDRVTILWQDLFATDIRAATVVTLYLLEELNLRLRPKLLRELAPGSRVVSHDFHMGDWEPDRVQRARGPDRQHVLYFWVVPAAVEGVWRGRVGERDAVLDVTQRFQVLTGTLRLDGRTSPITEGKLTGDRIAFTAGGVAFSGTVTGDAIEGRAGDGGPAWTARRAR